MWWPKLTGWATCRWGKPGRITSTFCSATSTSDTCSSLSKSPIRSISPRSHKRTSVATWSLRLRPVCRRLPASPTSWVRRASMFRCTSSRSSFHSKAPDSISCVICAMPRWMEAWSEAEMMPCAASISACARLPAISACHRRLSKKTPVAERLARALMGSENNADQAWALVSSWLWDGAESALVAWALDIRRAIIRRFRHPDNPGAAMQNTQILSTQPPLPDSGPPERSARSVRAAAGAGPGGQPPRGRALVFDACQVGVVLRAVLFVELVVGVGSMYGAGNPVEWLATLALLTGGALPATLLWLVTACSLKTVLQRLTTVQQYLAGVLLGALAGAYACGMLALVAQPTSAPWLASAATGALLAAMLV